MYIYIYTPQLACKAYRIAGRELAGWESEFFRQARPCHCAHIQAAFRLASSHSAEGVDLSGQIGSLSDAKDVAWRFFSMDPDNHSVAQIYLWPDWIRPRAYFATHIRQLFVEKKLSVLLAAGYQSCAVPHDRYSTSAYTLVFNYVNVWSSPSWGTHFPNVPSILLASYHIARRTKSQMRISFVMLYTSPNVRPKYLHHRRLLTTSRRSPRGRRCALPCTSHGQVFPGGKASPSSGDGGKCFVRLFPFMIDNCLQHCG